MLMGAGARGTVASGCEMHQEGEACLRLFTCSGTRGLTMSLHDFTAGTFLIFVLLFLSLVGDKC